MEEIELKEAEILHLQEGDVVVVRITRPITEQERDRLRKRLSELFPHNRSVVFDGGEVHISVVREETSESLTKIAREQFAKATGTG